MGLGDMVWFFFSCEKSREVVDSVLNRRGRASQGTAVDIIGLRTNLDCHPTNGSAHATSSDFISEDAIDPGCEEIVWNM
jgi:hypothetical protein